MSRHYRINGITGWREDSCMMEGDASHEGDRAVQQLLEEERVAKIDNGNAKGIPFVCEAENEEEAIEKYNEKFCDGEYLLADEADIEEVHKFSVDLLVDTTISLEVYGTDADDALSSAMMTEIDQEELVIDERHGVGATNEDTGEYTELY